MDEATIFLGKCFIVDVGDPERSGMTPLGFDVLARDGRRLLFRFSGGEHVLQLDFQ
jgi:hypothetical protein